jgi:hypothetical protein
MSAAAPPLPEPKSPESETEPDAARNNEDEQEPFSLDSDDPTDRSSQMQSDNTNLRKWGHINSYEYTTDNRKSFLIPGDPTYLLYCWDLLEENDLLATTIQRMNKRHGSSNAGTDLTDLESLKSSRAASAKAMANEERIVECIEKLMGTIESSAREEKEAREKQLQHESFLVERKAVLDRIHHLRVSLDGLERELKRIKRKHKYSQSEEDYDEMMDVQEEIKDKEQQISMLNNNT